MDYKNFLDSAALMPKTFFLPLLLNLPILKVLIGASYFEASLFVQRSFFYSQLVDRYMILTILIPRCSSRRLRPTFNTPTRAVWI